MINSFETTTMSESSFTYRLPEGQMEKHHCSTVVIGCIDFRFREANDAFIEEALGEKDFDTLNFPGGGKNFVEESPERESFVRAIEKVCVGLHQVKRLVLMNHWDCGAYGGSKHFHDAAAEESTHVQDLEKAKEFLQERFPDLEVVIAYNKYIDGSLEFRIVEEKAEAEEAA